MSSLVSPQCMRVHTHTRVRACTHTHTVAGLGERERENERKRTLSDLSSYEDTNPVDQGPTLKTSFNLNCFLEVLSPNTVWTSTYELRKRHKHSIYNTNKHTINT